MQIQEGEGWRLVVDADRQGFASLIGGEDWAVELRFSELESLRRGVSTLLAQQAALRDVLMPEEELDLEVDQALTPDNSAMDEAGSLFVAISGHPDRWALRFVLTPAAGCRAVEGGWSPQASVALAAALQGLSECCSGED